MARMPKGEPRSVPDPAGEQYDAMIRQERLKKRLSETAPGALSSSLAEPFYSDSRLDALRRQPSELSHDVTIGGQTYKEVDNGRANVLVPANDPSVAPAEMAGRQRALQRVDLMSGSPLAGAAYGIASLAGASPGARDAALMTGGAIDSLIVGAAPSGVPVRGQRSPPALQVAQAFQDHPNIRYGGLNAKGQATGVNATITEPMLGAGTKTNWRETPPGWQGGDYNEGRGHLLAKDLGGFGKGQPRNVVTLTQNPTNSPQMRMFENAVKRRVQAGEVMEYLAKPLYGVDALPPEAVLLAAYGSRGAPVARFISNPAGQRR